ncbi:tape measure protein, partial [Paraburkholderia aspalathi]|nr:tape measure protein [Paraburkholderia aspalathi]
MATDLEKLVVQLSADIKGFDKQLAKAVGVSNKQFNAVERRARQMNKNLDSIFARSFRGLTAPVAGIGAALGTREIARYADAWTTAGNKIAAASQVAGRQGRSLIELNDIARSTRSGISETADLYAKLLRSTAGVAKSELEVAKATEVVNKAFKAGGAAASEQAAGILQLAQGLGSGLLQGDELRSVRENAPLLAQAIADYFGTTVAGLKELGSQGKLTSEEIFKAILSGQAKIEGAFKATNSTIAEGFTMISNAMIQYVGTSDASLGVTSQLVAGLTILADNFDSVADGALQVATVIAGALIGRSLIGMIRTLGLTGTALISFRRPWRAASSAGALLSAFGGLSAAAGPLGMLIGGALVLSVGSYAKASWDAAKNSDALKAEMQQLGLYSSKAAKSLDETAESLDKLTAADKVRKLKQINDELDRLRNGGGGLFSREDELSNIAASARSPLRSIAGQFTVSDADKAARREIAKMAEDFAIFNIKADEVKRRLEAINSTDVSMGVIELGERLRETLGLVAANEAFSTRFGDTLTENISSVGEEIQSLKVYYREAADAEIISQKQYGDLSKLVDEFSKTGNGAEALRKSIQDIEKAAPNLNWLSGEFDRLIQKMGVVISTAQTAGRALSLASPLGPDENKQARASADPYIVQRKVENELSATFEKNALRKAGLKKDELAMENKLAEVRKRLIDEGVANPSKDMIDRISRAELAGDASRS